MSKPTLKPVEFIDQINLASGHSLIAGYKPAMLPHSAIAEKLDEHVKNMDLEKFGFFDTSSPNYTQYYPDVSAEDLDPTDDEFIEPTFRLISAAIVHKHWNPIDFGERNVLRPTMNLLIGQTVNPDHETPVGNALGAVKDVFWQKAQTVNLNGKDVEVPAGINGILKIDAKSNPRIARGILMDPPSIHSNSVTVRFKWIKSHADMEDSEFWSKLATYDQEGQLIRRIVTEVVSYHETSLVSHGADVFAQKIGDDGKIINPAYSDAVYNLSAENLAKRKDQKVFAFDYKSDLVKLSDNTTPKFIKNNNSETHNENKMEQLIALAALIGFTLDKSNDITEDNFEEKFGDHLKSLKESADNSEKFKGDLADKETEVQDLTKKVGDLEIEVADLKKKEPIADKALSAVRKRAEELYVALQGKDGKADESMLKVIKEGDYTTATSLLANFEKQAEGKFTASCKKCGSTDISRQSAAINDEGVVDPEKGAGGQQQLGDKKKSKSDIGSNIKKKRRNS